jgi:hypothetical protein
MKVTRNNIRTIEGLASATSFPVIAARLERI